MPLTRPHSDTLAELRKNPEFVKAEREDNDKTILEAVSDSVEGLHDAGAISTDKRDMFTELMQGVSDLKESRNN